MKKYKVFMACGTVQTILADEMILTPDGILRFYKGENKLFTAVFPKGGWHGFQDMSVYIEKTVTQ